MPVNTENDTVINEKEITRRSQLYMDQMKNISEFDPQDAKVQALAHIQAGMSLIINTICSKESFNQFILMLATTSVVQHNLIHKNCKDSNT